MAEFRFEELLLKDIIDKSVLAGASKALNISKEIVPRDWDRPPKPLNFKGVRKKEPTRKGGVVKKNGKYYNSVSGKLKQSLGMQKIESGEYVIGVRKGPTEDYAFVQEFGSKDDKIPSRSYLRILFKNKAYSKQILEVINKNLDHLLK